MRQQQQGTTKHIKKKKHHHHHHKYPTPSSSSIVPPIYVNPNMVVEMATVFPTQKKMIEISRRSNELEERVAKYLLETNASRMEKAATALERRELLIQRMREQPCHGPGPEELDEKGIYEIEVPTCISGFPTFNVYHVMHILVVVLKSHPFSYKDVTEDITSRKVRIQWK